MVWIVVDIESDGPCPGMYSMVSFAAVALTHGLDQTFEGKTAPISENWQAEALAISGISRAEHEAYPPAQDTMKQFMVWLEAINPGGKFAFVSDNPAFDWQFINYYFHRFIGHNPFGFSARRIGDIYSGWKGDVRLSGEWRQFRKTAHTHDPLDDAKGNAEALLALHALGLKLPIS